MYIYKKIKKNKKERKKTLMISIINQYIYKYINSGGRGPSFTKKM